MTADRNKTAITHAVTKAVTLWMNERGFKPIETEVPVAPRWTADLAAVLWPTQTAMISLRLVSRPPHWGSPQYEEWRRAVNDLRRLMTCLVEVKTSRADFRRDDKWTRPAAADLCYLAVPSKMIQVAEWPDGWGILEFVPSTNLVRCVRGPAEHRLDTLAQRDMIYAIAERRDHRTRYRLIREQQKQERIDDGVRQTCIRVDRLVDVVTDLVRGRNRYGEPVKTVDEALRWYGLKLPERSREQLAEVLGIKAVMK